MTNLELAHHHGLIVEHLINNSRWHRVATTDKPHSTNGAYCVKNGCITVQNWATDTEAHFYKENATASDNVANMAINKQVYDDKVALNQKAVKKAGWILSNTELMEHAYLVKKGFADMKGLVHGHKLVIPMRVQGNLVGVQMIDAQGDKRFLYGQGCKSAVHILGQGKFNVLVEGYASGLSVQQALLLAGISSKVWVCFSANNMIEIAKTLKNGIVIADNDASLTGQLAAEKIGWPYWISKTTGYDFNDESAYKSYFKLSQELKKIIMNIGFQIA